MTRLFLLLFGVAFCTPLPCRADASAVDPEKTKALEAVGFHLLPEGTVKRAFRWENNARVRLPFVAAYRLNEEHSVLQGESGKWFCARDGGDAAALVTTGEFGNFEELLKSVGFAALPAVPEGWGLRDIAQLPEMPTRMIADAEGNLIVLCKGGDVWKVNSAEQSKSLWYRAKDYVVNDLDEISALGTTLDAEGRLYVVTNQRDESAVPEANVVVIYRTEPNVAIHPSPLEPWLRAAYPYGVSAFTHGLGHIAPGPDGFLYVNSGSRTNQGEPGDGGKRSTEGETSLTACIWRLDPKASDPAIEIFAHGLRNAYGFCWDDRGRMFATDNGPEKDAPEELNLIVRGGHYGFPYEFADWGGAPDQPKKPEGLQTILPVQNLGPAAGGSAAKPLSTFDPHSSPAGIIYLDSRYPEAVRGSFFIVRYGSFKPPPLSGGFDLLKVRLDESDPAKLKAHVETFVSPLGRPLDICQTEKGVIYICETSRETSGGNRGGDSPPGRILELRFR